MLSDSSAIPPGNCGIHGYHGRTACPQCSTSALPFTPLIQSPPVSAAVFPAEPRSGFTRPNTYRSEFEKHAAPEAIAAYIAQARKHAEEIQHELGWLEGLYLRRVAEKATGQWP